MNITLGCIVKAKGLRGEVAVELLTDFPEHIEELEEVAVRFPDGRLRRMTIKSVSFDHRGAAISFRDIQDRDAAEALIGGYIEVPREEAFPLEEGEYYWFDLEGMAVVDHEGNSMGTVKEIIRSSAGDTIVAHDGSREILIPFIKIFIRSIDSEARRITVFRMPGLVDEENEKR